MSKKYSINVRSLILLNIVTILSIKNWPFMAQYGLSSAFFILLPALLFFMPTALVSAELATGWPEKGGVFVWVKEAFGERFGFLSVWLLWISNVVWYPTILSFIAVASSYIFNPGLAENTTYNFITIVAIFWSMILLNLKGLSFSSKLSSIGSLFGTLVPATLVVGLGFVWYFSGKPVNIELSWTALLPSMKGLNEWVFVTGILLGFAGIEMNAIHANNVETPQKNYPFAIFFSAIVIVILSVLGTVSISLLLLPKDINFAGGVIEVISLYLKEFHLSSFIPLLCLLVVLGGLGSVSAWIVGPNKGLVAAAQNGKYLPQFLCTENKNGSPKGIMVFQAVIVTILSSVFLFFPSVNIAFWILIALASQLYLIMYVLMFLSALCLRKTRPDVPRNFKIPFGKIGLWTTCGLGIGTCVFAFGIGFIPPEKLSLKNLIIFEFFLVTSMFLFCFFPFIMEKKYCKKNLKLEFELDT